MTADSQYKKKLIEVALPLEEINAACKAEKAVKTGTIRNLHKWFAPMPLPAWRALLFAALIDDPGDDAKRAELLTVIKQLVASGGSVPDAPAMLRARQILAEAYPGGLPTVMDPFCGAGSTLVEAQRLGLETFGSDLNPVPALISRTLTDVLPKVWNEQPIPHSLEAGEELQLLTPAKEKYSGFEGFLADLQYYAEVVRGRAWEKAKTWFPATDGEQTISWIWARTGHCDNPACLHETVLTTSWWLSKKAGDLAWIQPSVNGDELVLDVVTGQARGEAPEPPKTGRGASFRCLWCGQVIKESALIEEATTIGLGVRLMAVVAEIGGQRIYRAATESEIEAAANVPAPDDIPDIALPDNPRWFSGPRFGIRTQSDLYTTRQLAVLASLADEVGRIPEQVRKDGGSEQWATAIATVLGLVVGQAARYGSTQTFLFTRNGPSAAKAAFGRNDMPMTWDFVEVALFGESIGGWKTLLHNTIRAVDFVSPGCGRVVRADARTVTPSAPVLVATDPPYFDAIGYADLSDYFYLWHRRALRAVHPDLYGTLAAPKSGELTAVPSHHGNDKDVAREYFISGFTETFHNLKANTAPGLPILVVYASKEQKGGREEETRWSSILTAMIRADLEITGTWPIHGTTQVRMISAGTNAVATYVVMVCRPRSDGAGVCSLADFNRSLRRELKVAVRDLQASGVLPVDLAQAAMGPGMQIYSRYSAVVDQSGSRVPVDEALRLINSALGEVLDDQEGELDASSRFAVAWWEQHGWAQGRFDLADKMVRPKGISVDDLVQADVILLTPGWVKLKGMGDLDRRWVPATDKHPTAWEAVHHLADRLLDGGGSQEAGTLMGVLGTLRDPAQALVYRLHDIASKKGWTKDQERYNALIASWSDLLQVAATSIHSNDDGGRLF